MCPVCGALQPNAPEAAEIGPGVTIDRGDRRLVVDSRIGEGGMGIVWRAWPFFPPTDQAHYPSALGSSIVENGVKLRYFPDKFSQSHQQVHINS